MSKKSFSVHADYYWEICELTTEQRSELLLALICLATDKELPQLDKACAMLFRLMVAQSKRISEINSANGSKGGKANQRRKSDGSEHNGKGEVERSKPSVPISVTVSDTVDQEDIPPTPQEGVGADAESSNIDFITEHKFSASLESKVREWSQYKTEQKQAYKPTGFKALLTEIEHNAAKYGDEAVIKLINESMANNWRGIIWDKITKTGGVQNVSNESAQEYDMGGFHNALDIYGGSEIDEQRS